MAHAMQTRESATMNRSLESLRETRTRSRRIVQNFLLIWLDANIDESDQQCQKSLTQLRMIVNDIFAYSDSNQCIAFLRQVQDEKVFIIISAALSETIIPAIHNYPQLDCIYILDSKMSQSQTANEKWTKVIGYFNDLMSICHLLKQAVRQCDRESATISFLPETDTSYWTDKIDIDPTFMYSQLLKEALLEIHFDVRSVKALSDFCREQYRENSKELQNINDFEHNYHSHTPIWWYTSDSCLYRMLNRALRVFEIDIILKMGFFLADLHRQIEQLHQEQSAGQDSPLTVYRGQVLSKVEFNRLVQAKHGLISFNGFLSTSKDRRVSLEFAHSARQKQDFVGLLFVITIEPRTSATPYALVNNVSYFHDSEQEVLFSMPTVFHLGDIQRLDRTKDWLWQIELTLANEHHPNLTSLTRRMREATEGAIGWHRLGQLLVTLNAFDKAEDLYKTLLNDTAASREGEKAHIYHMLGMIKMGLGDYPGAVSFYEKSLSIQERIYPSSNANLASTYNNMGSAYERMDQYSEALSFQEKALAVRQRILPVTHPDLATSYNNIGMIYAKKGEYTKALSFYKKDLEISEQSLPPNHPDLGTSYNNIALVYNRMGQYRDALTFYEKALSITQQSLPSNHPDLAATYNNIGAVYYEMEEYSKAISFYQKALNIIEQNLSPYHPNLAISYNNIAFVYYQMGDCARALSCYEKVLEIKQKTLPPNHRDLAPTHNLIGKVFDRMGNYTKAMAFYERALEMAQKSLPTNQSELELYKSDLERVKRRAALD